MLKGLKLFSQLLSLLLLLFNVTIKLTILLNGTVIIIFSVYFHKKFLCLSSQSFVLFQIFDSRIRLLNGDHCSDGTVRVPNYERCPSYERCITYQDTGIHFLSLL